MRTARLFSCAIIIQALLPPVSLYGQGRPIEFGLDAGVSYDIMDDSDLDNATRVRLPAQRLRVGFSLTERFAIGPSVSFSHVSIGGDSFTEVGFRTSLAYYITADASKPRFYAQVGGGLDFLDVGASDTGSDTQWGAGAGLGVKLPVGKQFAVRLEANALRLFESDERDRCVRVGGFAGFSFFTS